MSKTPAEPSTGEREQTLIKHAIIMMVDGDLCKWSDAHNRVTVDALRAALAAQAPSPVAPSEPPLFGNWHHGEGILVSGTIRIARWDCDTNPPTAFRDKALDWVCATLNSAVTNYRERAALPDAPVAPSDDMNPIKEGWQISVTSGHSGYGVYAHMSECPEEGAVLVAAIPDEKAKQKPILWVARAKCDSYYTIAGELSVEDVYERPFELQDSEVWECLPLYAAPIQPRQAEPETKYGADAVEVLIAAGMVKPRQAPSDALTDGQVHDWWKSENGLEDCDPCKWVDFLAIVRAVEKKLAILSPQGDRK